MKVAITTTQIAFVKGGAELCALELQNALIKAGHQAEIITMPFVDQPPENLSNHIAAARLMDITNSWGGHIDLCIGLKFPAFFMPHPNKVLWMLHQHRALYDLYDKVGFGPLKSPENDKLRDMVIRADDVYLPEAKRIYTISQNVSNRLMKYNKIGSTPLYQPCPGAENFYAGEYKDYILMPSRINATKRQTLALDALRLCKEDVKIYFVGRADAVETDIAIKKRVENYNLQDKVTFFDYVPEEQKLELYANAKAVLFIPVDEDYGYITLEAMSASKPIITATDSGGPLEFVENGVSGIVTEPTAEDLAKALDEIWRSKTMAKEFGERGNKRLKEMDITWEHVVKELTKP